MTAALIAAGYDRPAERVRDCAEWLVFALVTDPTTAEITWRLRSAPYCRYRHCPVCQWRRSLRNKAIILSALPRVLDAYPTARFAMLTLTVRNCEIADLRGTLADMGRGWQRLIQRRDWPAIGWVRAVEVTRAKDGTAHPHYHALLMLPASYYSGQAYVPTREWVRRWRDAMRLDYDPVCDIRQAKGRPQAVTPDRTPVEARVAALQASIAEVVKYATKAADLVADADWLGAYIAQVRGTKALTSGGVLKGIFKPDTANEDLVHVGDDQAGDMQQDEDATLRYHWRTKHKRYARKRT